MSSSTVEVVVPQIGEAVSELTLVAWRKQEGDFVRQGEPLFEIDSDKAIVEVEAFVEGRLVKIMQPAGSSVRPQQPVAVIDRSADTTQPETVRPAKPSPLAQRIAADLSVDLAGIQGSGPNGRITAADVRRSSPEPEAARVSISPKARHMAKAQGLDPRSIMGTGVDGMITVRDLNAIQSSIPVQNDAIPFNKVRQTIAARTTASKQQVPHFYLLVDVNMSAVKRLRTYCQTALGWAHTPTYTDILVRACALTLVELPALNVAYTDGGLRAVSPADSIGIGVAVSTPEGVVVPVLPDAPRLSLAPTTDAMRDLAERARNKRLRAQDYSAKRMVVSNLGMHGVDAFIAIIDPPDPMILAVGRVADKVVPIKGRARIRPMCTLTLSADHRVLDGVQGAQFLDRLKNRLENPFDLLG